MTLRKESRNKVAGRSEGAKKARKKVPIDWELVRKLCQIQCTQEEICAFIEVAEETLRKAAKEVYNKPLGELFSDWRLGGNCSLRRKQWHLADTSAAVAIFLGKQYLGQDDDYNLNHNGAMVQVVHYGDGDPEQWKDKNGQDKILE